MTPSNFYDHDRLRDLCPVLAYDDETNLYLLEGSALAFAFECHPLSGADQQTAERLSTAFNHEYPKGTIASIMLYASPDIRGHIAAYEGMRKGSRNPIDEALTQARIKFLEQSLEPGASMLETQTLRPRDTKIVISFRVPYSSGGQLPTNEERRTIAERARSVKAVLQSAGLHPRALLPGDYIRLMNTIFDHRADAHWRRSASTSWDQHELIRDQVVDPGVSLEATYNGLTLCGGERRLKLLSVKRFPPTTYFGFARLFLSDVLQGARGIRDHFMISLNIFYPDAADTRTNLEGRKMWLTHEAYGPLLKFNSRLGDQKIAYDQLFEALNDGDRPVRCYLSFGIFTTPKEESQAVSAATAYLNENGLQAMEDRFIVLPAFLNMLPMHGDPVAVRELFRYKTFATRHALSIAPLFSDWKGTGTAELAFISRTGQVMGCSLYDTDGGMNCFVAAKTGAGKSFLVNDMVLSALSCGGRAWMIDAGESYKKLCHSVGGQFISFGLADNICLNPFPLVKDYAEEVDMLCGIVASMAVQRNEMTDFQYSAMRRHMNLIWQQKGHEMLVDDIAQACLADDDQRVRDIGAQLFAFTSKGEYGRYFHGRNNLELTNRFIVIELGALKNRQHLQQVVLLQLMFQVQNQMYGGDKTIHRHVFIDEAWQHLAGSKSEHGTGKQLSEMIAGFYRLLRKYEASATIITQSVLDLYENSNGRAIAENTAHMYLLAQEDSTVDSLRGKKLLPIPDAGYELLKSVHTDPGNYSEILFKTPYGIGVGRLIVDPFKRLLYTTKGREVAEIEALEAQGHPLHEAINIMLRSRGQQRAA